MTAKDELSPELQEAMLDLVKKKREQKEIKEQYNKVSTHLAKVRKERDRISVSIYRAQSNLERLVNENQD